jgi:hypothetical protein
MSTADLGLWAGVALTAVCAITGIMSVIYIAIPFHAARRAVGNSNSPRIPRKPFFVIGALVLLSWAGFAFDYYDRHSRANEVTCDLIYGWGTSSDGSFYVSVNSSSLMNYANKYGIALIINTTYSNIDNMTDTIIEKSELFTITGNNQSISIPGPHTLRGPAQPGLVNINYCLIALPNNLAISQVRNLSDVSALGGKVIDCKSKGENLKPA